MPPLPPTSRSLTRTKHIVAANFARFLIGSSGKEIDVSLSFHVGLNRRTSPLNSYRLPISDCSQLSIFALFFPREWKLACWQDKITLSSFAKRLQTFFFTCKIVVFIKRPLRAQAVTNECAPRTGAGHGCCVCLSVSFWWVARWIYMRCRRKTFTIFSNYFGRHSRSSHLNGRVFACKSFTWD